MKLFIAALAALTLGLAVSAENAKKPAAKPAACAKDACTDKKACCQDKKACPKGESKDCAKGDAKDCAKGDAKACPKGVAKDCPA